MWHLVVTTLLIAIFTWYLKTWTTPKNLPPGPRGMPIFGYLPFLGKKPYITLANLAKKYGDVFMFYIGHERIVVLSTYKLIKEVLHTRGEIFQNRPDSSLVTVIFDSEHGIFGASNNKWVQTRRFTLTTLRDFGMGKASLEPKILDEVNCLTEEIKKTEGKPVDLRDLLTLSTTNVLLSMMFGERMDYTNKDFLKMISLSKPFSRSLGIDQWSFYLPKFLVKLFGYSTPADYGTALYKKILQLLKIKLEGKQLNQNEFPENFIDAFKIEAKKPNVNQSYFTDKQLAKLLTDLFIAGNDSTSSTIEFILFYLIKYPNVQKKIHEEIDEIIGQERNPTMADLKRMPYTEAIIRGGLRDPRALGTWHLGPPLARSYFIFIPPPGPPRLAGPLGPGLVGLGGDPLMAIILEISRIISLTPLSVPHVSSKDVDLNGYFIPKGTTIYTNLWALHHNSELFPEPEVFKPKRFLSESNKIKRIDELIPFSIGKRQCPGEGLARMQLFLYLTSLFQHFSFTKEGEVDLQTQYSLVIEPARQKIRAILRSSLSKSSAN